MERVGDATPVVAIVNVSIQRSVSFFVGLAFWICSTAWLSTAQSKPSNPAAPLWTVPVVGAESGGNWKISDPIENGFAGVTFLDDNRLIVHEVNRTGRLSSRTSLDSSSAFRLHLSILDASSGKELSTKDWGTRIHTTSIHVTSGGVLVRTGQIVKFYSKDFMELQQLSLPQLDTHDSWTISVSTTGKTVMFNHTNLKESRSEIRDGNTFEQLRAWRAIPLPPLYSISDAEIATADSHQEHVLVSEFGKGQWDHLGNNFTIGCVSLPIFVTDSLLANGACKELSVMTIGGEVVMTDHSEKQESFDGEKIAVAQSGLVLAASLSRGSGGGFFDTDVHRTRARVAVYNLSLKARVLIVDVDPLPKNNYDFSLSPDGAKLAILNDRKVSVYSVPVHP